MKGATLLLVSFLFLSVFAKKQGKMEEKETGKEMCLKMVKKMKMEFKNNKHLVDKVIKNVCEKAPYLDCKKYEEETFRIPDHLDKKISTSCAGFQRNFAMAQRMRECMESSRECPFLCNTCKRGVTMLKHGIKMLNLTTAEIESAVQSYCKLFQVEDQCDEIIDKVNKVIEKISEEISAGDICTEIKLCGNSTSNSENIFKKITNVFKGKNFMKGFPGSVDFVPKRFKHSYANMMKRLQRFQNKFRELHHSRRGRLSKWRRMSGRMGGRMMKKFFGKSWRKSNKKFMENMKRQMKKIQQNLFGLSKRIRMGFGNNDEDEKTTPLPLTEAPVVVNEDDEDDVTNEDDDVTDKDDEVTDKDDGVTDKDDDVTTDEDEDVTKTDGEDGMNGYVIEPRKEVVGDADENVAVDEPALAYDSPFGGIWDTIKTHAEDDDFMDDLTSSVKDLTHEEMDGDSWDTFDDKFDDTFGDKFDDTFGDFDDKFPSSIFDTKPLFPPMFGEDEEEVKEGDDIEEDDGFTSIWDDMFKGMPDFTKDFDKTIAEGRKQWEKLEEKTTALIPNLSKNGVGCTICKVIVGFIEEEIKTFNASEEQVKKAVEALCKLYPFEIGQEVCKNITEDIDEIIQLLEKDLDPKDVCIELKLCPSKMSKTDDKDVTVKVQTYVSPTGDCKPMCGFWKQLYSDDAKSVMKLWIDVKQDMMALCELTKYKAKCDKMLATFRKAETQLGAVLTRENMNALKPSMQCKCFENQPIFATEKTDKCQLCKQMEKGLKKDISDIKDSIQYLLSQMNVFCKGISQKEECYALIKNFNSSFGAIDKRMEATNDLCSILGYCTEFSDTNWMNGLFKNMMSSFDSLFKPVMGGSPLGCTFCKTCVKNIDETLKQNKINITNIEESAPAVKDGFTIFCQTKGKAGEFQQICKTISNGMETVQKSLLTSQDGSDDSSSTICKSLGRC